MEKISVGVATGNLGNTVIKTLLKKIAPQQIHVISRSEEKLSELKQKGVKTFIGNYNDVTSLEIAMESVDSVLLISAGD